MLRASQLAAISARPNHWNAAAPVAFADYVTINLRACRRSRYERGYLLLCLENGHYAISLDQSGNNIPKVSCTSGWQLIKAFDIGVREAMPMAGNPESLVGIKGLTPVGYRRTVNCGEERNDALADSPDASHFRLR
jgi:hypothetical protein